MSKVLIIGLDSADAELIERWSDEGALPTLAALRREGTWGRLGTSAEVMHVSAWPTIYTGTTPGRHGLYHAYQVRAGEQEIRRADVEANPVPPFWKYLDDAGRRCIVVDAFMNCLLPDFRGIQILEYGTWTWFTDPVTTPGHLRREILRRFGPYPAPEHLEVFTVPEPIRFRDRLIRGAAVKADVARWLLTEQPWSMAFINFGEPHGAGHYLWHVSDATHPAAPAGGPPAGAENALRDVYAAVDTAIGRILDEVDDRTTVIITSGDGMGPNYAGCHLVPEALHRLGLFHAAGVGKTADRERSGRRPRRSPASVLREAIPLSVRHAVTRCLPRSVRYRLNLKWANSNIDWSRTSVFCIPNSNEAYLRVNLEGREPLGRVDPASYPDLLAELGAHLAELVVPASGRAAARRIFAIDELFPGPERPHLPDLVVSWDPDARVLDELHSERCGRIKGVAGYQTAPYYTGNHRPNAFVLARGPHVPAGGTLADGDILDIAPTTLALLGVDPPAHFEGKAWSEFLAS